jgi:peroxiredoxin
VVSISSDESRTEAGAFAREIKATFPVVHDPQARIFEAYGVLGLPTNVVIGRDGKVVAAIEGVDLKALDSAVARAVARR